MYINYVVNFFLEGLDWIVSRGAAPPPSLNPRSCILDIVRVSGRYLIAVVSCLQFVEKISIFLNTE